MLETASIEPIIAILAHLFTLLNLRFFDGKLVQPVITVSPRGRRNVLGWFTLWKAWKEEDGNGGYYEINVCAESLCLPFEDVAEIMLHEMVHLFSLMMCKKDCSRGNYYHNSVYRDAALNHGLLCSRHKSYGFAITSLADETVMWLKTKYGDYPRFPIYRDSKSKPKKLGKPDTENKPEKVELYEYVCPSCHAFAYAPKDADLICGKCNVAFKEYDPNGIKAFLKLIKQGMSEQTETPQQGDA